MQITTSTALQDLEIVHTRGGPVAAMLQFRTEGFRAASQRRAADRMEIP